MTDRWNCSRELDRCLDADDWLSPNTYCRKFAPLADIPAVYLFMLFKADDFMESLVAYVGMSTRLKQRIDSHNVLPEIREHGFWTKIWFKPVERQKLREIEAQYITRFDPPWNIQGRVRGLAFQ